MRAKNSSGQVLKRSNTALKTYGTRSTKTKNKATKAKPSYAKKKHREITAEIQLRHPARNLNGRAKESQAAKKDHGSTRKPANTCGPISSRARTVRITIIVAPDGTEYRIYPDGRIEEKLP